MNAHTNVALPLAYLHHAFDTLKRTATALFTRPLAPYTSTTPSNNTSSHLDASNVANSACMSTPHLSGAAIVASVGFGHSPFSRPSPLPRLLLHRGEALSTPPPPTAISSLNGLDIGIDVESASNEAPHSLTHALSTHSSTVRSPTAPTSTTNIAMQSSKVGATFTSAESLSPSMTSTPYASSSTGSDSSFECITPPTAAADVHNLQEPHIQSPASTPLSAGAPAQPTWLDVHRALKALEANVSKLVQQSKEAARPEHITQPQGPQFDAPPELDIIYYDDDEPVDIEAESHPDDDASPDVDTDEDDSEADDDLDDVRPPTVLRNPHSGAAYSVEGVVADGGFSRVAQVVDDEGRRRAAKIVHKRAVCKRAGAREALLREKAFMVKASEMGSRRLVGLIESWEDEENIYFIMVRASFGAVAESASHAALLGTLPMLVARPAEPPRRLREARTHRG